MWLGHLNVRTESPKQQFKTLFLVINTNCDLSHKHYAPERAVWSIQTLGFPEAITISVIRSWKTQICNPRTIKICYWNCFEIKAWTLGRYNVTLGPLSAWKIPLISGYLYLLSATVITVIRSRYVHVSTQLIPFSNWSQKGAFCKMEWKHDMLHTCMSLSEHF